jgi:hypothetical protein
MRLGIRDRGQPGLTAGFLGKSQLIPESLLKSTPIEQSVVNIIVYDKDIQYVHCSWGLWTNKQVNLPPGQAVNEQKFLLLFSKRSSVLF